MRSRLLTWSAALGLTGFMCGFFGPLILQPDANQGPLLGLLITGPGGLLLGAIAGGVLGAFGVCLHSSRKLLAAVCTLSAVAIFYATLPGPVQEATLADIEVRSCAPALQRESEAFAEWDRRLRSVTWAKSPANWREKFQMAASFGSVVTVKTVRTRAIQRARTPWRRGQLTSSGWQSGPVKNLSRPDEFYFARSCQQAPANGIYVTKSTDGEGGYPPADPAAFLGMVSLEPIPAELSEFARP